MVRGCYLASSGWKARMLLNVVQGTGPSATKNLWTQTVNSREVEKLL